MTGIYEIRSLIIPDRVYIGSAIGIPQRWCRHLSELKHGKHPNKKLQNHYNKYGSSDLAFSVLMECTPTQLLDREQFYINASDPYFNICKTAGSSFGLMPSNETRQKISKSKKGQIPWNKGVKTGVVSSSQFKKGIAPWNKNQKMAEEQKRKLKIAWINRKLKKSA